ncbi:plakophilin-3 isoform X1 [Rousettus aegyptiacus]|uniref:plakophilin-3 isoform X1 n=1 Tax=Rousettus aegyptiacus TaxID=9407 RepID=UPI00168D2AC3|nr:plakophilin-3 isoform X1 [Rousettus aegyptiacus]
MQDSNFLLSALQPEAGVCSLALPSDLQLDRRGTQGPEAERLRAARVQEQVRARLLQLGQQQRHNGTAEPGTVAGVARGTSWGQYHTLQTGFSSRSQGPSGDSTSTFRPIAKPAYGPASWSSRSAMDLSSSRRLSSAHNGGSTFGAAGYGGAQPATAMPPRPVSYHERGGAGSRMDYDTLSLHSLRLGPGGLDDHCSVVSEQLEPTATSAYRAFAYERQASSSSGRQGGPDWPDAAEGPPGRTIRAPAMRTLQRFQSGHRSRGGAGALPGGVLEPVARAPSVRSLSLSLADAGHLPDVRGLDSFSGHRTLQRLSSGFDDIDLPSAVKYLMASDPNLQVLGAAYIQHKCYSDAAAKKQARSLQAVPRLVKLFNHANQEVQRHATGAMRNLIYDNADNKLALVEESGIFELLRTLREQDSELRKNVTGILWNLSSSDHLKDRLARDTLEQLTDLVLSPLSGAGGPPLIQQNASEAEIFYNATGFLRNLSSASQATRQKMRECHGLVDALVAYINHALDVGKCEDKSVENAVCVLRNLSYRLYDEMPPSALQRLEGRGRRDAAGAPPGEVVGCFTPQSRRLRELPLTADALTFAEVSKDPKGQEWLWSPQIVGLYNRLLQRCELNRHTTEAAAGALQNITAGDRRWAGVLSRLALEQERILNPLLDRVRTADHHQLRSLTGLIRNLSRNARNKDEMSTKVVSHLIEKLPGSVGEKAPPADVLVNIIAVLNNLVVASPIAARDLLYFDGLRKLVFIKKKRDSPDSEKSSRAASSLLANLWQYSKLHRDFRAVSSRIQGRQGGGHGPGGGRAEGHSGRNSRPACHLTRPPFTAEGLSKGGLPGPVGKALPEEGTATQPGLRGTGSAPCCLPASLEEKAECPAAAHWSPSCNFEGPGHQGEDRGWGTAGD